MKCRVARTVAALGLTAVVMAVMTGCSLKKNTAASRNYMAFITRYNIYYNGDVHYKETLEEMEKKYEDDFTETLFVHPAEARQNEKAPQPTGDFTRSIEKAQKAIQVRTIKSRPARKPGKSSDPAYKAWMKREEYNPFLHNAWMMMGRSQFLNGDFLGAAATFLYVSKHFSWLPATVTEAKIWQARSYVAIDWLFEAETILSRIKPDQLVNKQMTHLYNLTYADFFIKSKDNAKAIPYLKEAIRTASGTQKTRLNFLLGQLYESVGDKKAAYEAFGKAGNASSASYRTKFNARIRQSEVFQGDDIEKEVKALKRMVRYDRNKEYLDQIYYAIGNLYLSRGDTLRAIDNYRLAVDKSTRSGKEKAIAQLTLGGLYYDRGDYVKAQPCYSEAISLIPENYPDYGKLKKRTDYLDELAVYAQNVTLQDSLLKLSYMTPEEQREMARRLIEELKKKEKEAAEQARLDEYRAGQQAQGGQQINQNNAPTTFTINTDNSWYFYNQSTVTAGKTEFQRRWGSRKLEDDWRRRNKATYAFDTASEEDDEATGDADTEEGETPQEGEPSAEEMKKTSDPHYEEYYLSQIPKTDAERMTANDVIQEGLYNMGVILKDKMEDFVASEHEFAELIKRYPDNIYRLDAYYNLYLMAVRSDDVAKAEKYRLLITSEFPESAYGQAMRDPKYIDNLREMEARQNRLYEDAYQAYLDNDNDKVHAAMRKMEEEFPLSKLMPNFMFIDALSYVTENKPEEFKAVLTQMLDRYPDTKLTPYAAAYVKGMNEGRKLHSGGSNIRGMLWETRLGNDSTAVTDGELEFDLNPDDRQLFILLYPTDKVASNQLLFDIARHNFSSFVVKDFDLEQMNFGQLGLLIVKPFENVAEINHYRSVIESDAELQLPREVRPVVISAKNFETLLGNGASFDDYFRYVEDKTYRDTEERVLPPEFFGPSEGIPSETIEESDVLEELDNEPDATTEPADTPVTTQPVEPVPNQPAVSEPQSPTVSPQPLPSPSVVTPKVNTPVPDYPTGSEDDPLLD